MTTRPPYDAIPDPSVLPGWDDPDDDLNAMPPGKPPDPTFVWVWNAETGEMDRVIQKDAVVAIPVSATVKATARNGDG